MDNLELLNVRGVWYCIWGIVVLGIGGCAHATYDSRYSIFFDGRGREYTMPAEILWERLMAMDEQTQANEVGGLLDIMEKSGAYSRLIVAEVLLKWCASQPERMSPRAAQIIGKHIIRVGTPNEWIAGRVIPDALLIRSDTPPLMVEAIEPSCGMEVEGHWVELKTGLPEGWRATSQAVVVDGRRVAFHLPEGHMQECPHESFDLREVLADSPREGWYGAHAMQVMLYLATPAGEVRLLEEHKFRVDRISDLRETGGVGERQDAGQE